MKNLIGRGEDLFEDSVVGAPTPAPKAPHLFIFRPVPRGMFCSQCKKRMNDAGEFCEGEK